MNTEFFIARRISSPEAGRTNVMVRIATLTVAVGMAVMIVALAVAGGFKKEITDKLVGFSGHIRVVSLDNNNTYETTPIRIDTPLMEDICAVPGIVSVAPFAMKGGMLKTPDAVQAIGLKGIGPDYDTRFLESVLVEGGLPVKYKDILISKRISELLRLDVNRQVEILIIGGSNPVRRDRYKVCGIYSTGMDDMDMALAYADLRSVQRLNRWEPGQASGYEVMTEDFSRIREYGDEIYRVVFDHAETSDEVLKVEDVVSQNPNVFDWLGAHDMNAAVIITIMLLVALLNMISALLIILLEKTSMIGVLKALGMTNGKVQKIFLYRSLRIVLTGVFWGDLIGLVLIGLQYYTHAVRLDSAGYFISHVPVEFGWGWFVGLNVGLPLVMTILLAIPALAVSSIKPDRTMRYQ